MCQFNAIIFYKIYLYMYKIILFLTFTTELFNTNLLIKSYGRNYMVSKELSKDDIKQRHLYSDTRSD